MALRLVLAGSMLALTTLRPALAQPPAHRGTASSDSAIYATFFETLNRQARDTIFAEEHSIVFQGISPHYDSITPGLAATLIEGSAPPRKTSSLHLPPPLVIFSAATPQTVREGAMYGAPGPGPKSAQGIKGVWQFSPIAYSRDGREAMFYYRMVCGSLCGEETIVWVTKKPNRGWEIKRTAILVIS